MFTIESSLLSRPAVPADLIRAYWCRKPCWTLFAWSSQPVITLVKCGVLDEEYL